MLFTDSDKTLYQKVINLSITSVVVLMLMLFCWLMHYSLVMPLFLLFLALHLKNFKEACIKIFLNLGLLLAIILFVSYAINQYSTIPLFYIPVASIAMLTMLLYNDHELSFIMAFASSVLVCLVIGGDFGMLLTFFIGSLTGAYSVRGARLRGQLIGAGLFVSVMNVICLFLINFDSGLILTKTFASNKLYPLAANGFISTFIVAAVLKIFEYLFHVLTNFSLLELSDFNQPLLKKMILEAPGTYHHSLVVSNLSEAAADSIGANALLARVGAYYHDIGKMDKPEYYTENQLIGTNKHDGMEPSMSRLVILNHVKEGIELAKKYKLNQLIVDFIPQHHGTGLVYYFYQKALEEAENGEVISEDNFRYPGPKPQTRETAIVLLADSVEGAVRALDEKNMNRIGDTVRKIINNKFIDGQLDECNLTLKEIDQISLTFVRILGGMYHGRVKYPEKKNSVQKKSAEKNRIFQRSESQRSQKDNQNGSSDNIVQNNPKPSKDTE
ncbi:MAG: hypothetical protein A2Y03_10760 [Omnitrophica WOR_2 bacterium GWF2_38_59]|nr:MAG: hypothetical protein A2Y03_10760 [Omnitrophica WOR_2 bacterium GWF2_38_59]OGX50641.1 MAG: hypothetical protein A2243_03475 [Omnitrophica WOR_2 bacterium RIFOXYA2_FULL_38_17]OGX54636.1 MAG: hypothetical protein A2267_02150 [Omnitrophica WOR_2 bacterium RIFOXYA12_FULL_38_10]OGX56178.1 MAG: hypothetical protein A2447_07935 [Omnitrophica WOR_2 bacterium RIFOXYC2_FULL_38_12]OGX59770.1 MAG: hypothetical protein A2306_02775 [Omnitrophica WOR_2 bacterium RIFOXYB2_FULL_38_16]HBG60942.1 hypothet